MSRPPAQTSNVQVSAGVSVATLSTDSAPAQLPDSVSPAMAMTPTDQPSSEISPADQPLAKRQFRLAKFEMSMLDEDGLQKAMFQTMLANKGGFESENEAWLSYKLKAMGEDGESLRQLLDSKMPKNLTRTKKRKPGPDDPQGVDKFNVCSDIILHSSSSF